jgi:hypothetical protein
MLHLSIKNSDIFLSKVRPVSIKARSMSGDLTIASYFLGLERFQISLHVTSVGE